MISKVRDMKSTPFCIMVDGSNDAGLEKLFPISVRIFDINYNRIMTKFFDMNMLEGRDANTAEFMFSSIDQQLTSNDLSWDMVSALGQDNTNGNIGDHNSIKSRLLEKKIWRLSFQVALAIFYIMHLQKLVKLLEMSLALMSKIVASTCFIGLINHQNANRS